MPDRPAVRGQDGAWRFAYAPYAGYIPIAGSFIGGSTAKASVLNVTFDRSGVVKAYGTATQGANSGFGRN